MVATHYSTLLGFSLKPSFHRCEMIEMAEQSLADIFFPSIMDFIEREPDSEEVDFDVDQLLPYGNSPMLTFSWTLTQ